MLVAGRFPDFQGVVLVYQVSPFLREGLTDRPRIRIPAWKAGLDAEALHAKKIT